MNKTALIILIGIICFSCQSSRKGSINANKGQKPNIIYILADDLGYGDLGYNGQKKIHTPNIDQLANEGMVFTNHYAGSAVCGPSRASLMTGLHTGHGIIRENPRWTASGKPATFDENTITVADELKKAGYTTGVIGKWGLAELCGKGVPNKQGFDYFYGFNRHRTAHHYYADSVYENQTQIRIEGNNVLEKKGKYIHNLFTEKAVDFINTNKDEKFFLYLAYTLPHYELTIPDEYKSQYKDLDWPLREMKPGHYLHDENGHVTYASMVSKLDSDVGLINQLLKDLGIEENTIVIFTSDNGHEYDNIKAEFFNSNGEFKGKKRDLYEGGIHSPFVMKWPQKITPGSVNHHISAFWDFYPTACEIAGVRPSGKIDGISFLPSVIGDNENQKTHEYLYWEFNEKRGPVQAIRQNEWKAVRYKGKNMELYNLNEDSGEENNLAEKYPDKVKEFEILMKIGRTEHPEFPLEKMHNRKD
ncbi:arylsulfatase [Labilibacter sediminis]|nr:arylsulfatase [Labilibacter sediminis]